MQAGSSPEKSVCPSVYQTHELNGVLALIVRYFTEFDSLLGRLCHSG